jgi:hypothetical protein
MGVAMLIYVFFMAAPVEAAGRGPANTETQNKG